VQHTGYILDYLRLSLRSNKCAITHLFSHLLLLALVSCVGTCQSLGPGEAAEPI
jgi:hypothetical protein